MEVGMQPVLTTVRVLKQTKWHGAVLLFEIELPPGHDALAEAVWIHELYDGTYVTEATYYYTK
jgi:hypothetical protein